MYSVEMTVTPELAKHWLETGNKTNRTIREINVERFAADMRAGRWQLNGEAIQISQSGVLKNGQHRLLGVIKAGIPVHMYVTFDVPDEVNIYDAGSIRKPEDDLKLTGIDATKNMRSLANFLYTNVLHYRLTRGMINDFLTNEGVSLRKAVNMVNKKTSPARIAPCQAVAWILMVNGWNCEKLDRFFDVVCSGYYNDGEESAVALRNMLFEKVSSTRTERDAIYRLTSKALMDFFEGKKRKIKYRDYEYDNIDIFAGTKAETIVKSYIR